MPNEIVVSVISLVGTIVGSLGGVLISNRLTNYRIMELEKKVDKHNNFAGRIPVIEERIAVLNHRISDLEGVTR